MTEVHPRHQIRNIADADLKIAISKIITEHNLTIGETITILTSNVYYWARCVMKDEG